MEHGLGVEPGGEEEKPLAEVVRAHDDESVVRNLFCCCPNAAQNVF